jgi:hypothetical protein
MSVYLRQAIRLMGYLAIPVHQHNSIIGGKSVGLHPFSILGIYTLQWYKAFIS